MNDERPLAYLLIGTPGSGRRALLADLIAEGLIAGDRPLTLLAATEPEHPFDARLGTVKRWRSEDNAIAVDVADEGSGLAAECTHLFFVLDGRANPVDQIEQFKTWLYPQRFDFARAITVVDCALAQANPPLLAWIDACVHFSDVVLLAKREGVPNKWMSDFQARYQERFLPALFEFVKQGRVQNPARVLLPEARRMTHVFDDDVDEQLARDLAPEAEIDFGDGEAEEADGGTGPSDDEAPGIDPYFERRQSGRRVLELPDVRQFLPPA
jgi:hypothetical protein